MHSSKEIRSLTGLRGVAALVVVFYHYFQRASLPAGVTAGLVRHGYIAVDLFFVLSGFVLALTYARKFESNPSTATWGRFLLNRFARIYPLYAFCTLATFVLGRLGLAGDFQFSIRQLASNLACAQAWRLTVTIDGPCWSISTEVAAYLAFPVLILQVAKADLGWRRLMATATACSLLLVFVATRTTAQVHGWGPRGPLDVISGDTIYPLLRCFAGFVLGLLTFRAAVTPAVAKTFRRPAVADGVAVAVLLALMTQRSDYFIVPLFAVAVLGFSFEEGLVAKFLATRPVYWLGLISYSVYLIHGPMERGLYFPLVNLARSARLPHVYVLAHLVLVCFVLAVAQLTYGLIEVPARRALRNRVGRVGTATPGPVEGRAVPAISTAAVG